MSLNILTEDKKVLHTWKYSPPFIFAPFPSFLAGKFKTENSNVLNYLFLNTVVSEQIQAGAKLFESVERRKLQGAKLTLFTV